MIVSGESRIFQGGGTTHEFGAKTYYLERKLHEQKEIEPRRGVSLAPLGSAKDCCILWFNAHFSSFEA